MCGGGGESGPRGWACLLVLRPLLTLRLALLLALLLALCLIHWRVVALLALVLGRLGLEAPPPLPPLLLAVRRPAWRLGVEVAAGSVSLGGTPGRHGGAQLAGRGRRIGWARTGRCRLTG